jgi:hypothetical protein
MNKPTLILIAMLSAAAAAAQNAAPAPAQAAPAAAVQAAPAPWTLGGSLLVQPMAAYAGAGSWNSSNLSYGSGTTLGLTFMAGSGRARAEASIEGAILTGSSAQLAWDLAGTPFGRADEILAPGSSSGADAALAARIRTLYARIDLDWVALTLGRQVINYGRGTLWSPTDIFTELDLSGISPVRRGTDAVRATFPLGVTAGLDAAAAPTGTPADGRYSLRLNSLLGDVDAAVMAARDGALGGWLFGADLKGDVVVGLTGEVIYFQPDGGGQGWVRAAAGVDWSIGDFILAAEYYYNGGLAEDVLFPHAHNLYASATWNASELLRLSATVIGDLKSAKGTLTFLTTVSAAQNADVTAFIQAANGSAGYGIGNGISGASWTAQVGLGLEVKF